MRAFLKQGEAMNIETLKRTDIAWANTYIDALEKENEKLRGELKHWKDLHWEAVHAKDKTTS